MIRKIPFFIALILFTGCQMHQQDKILFYSTYKDDRHVIEKEFLKMTTVNFKNYDSVTVFEKGAVVLKYDQTVSPAGIYRYLGGSKILTHSFADSAEHKSPKQYFPFFNFVTVFKKSKSYKMGTASYTLSLFYESSGTDSGLASYYLDGIGFICFYSFEGRKIILCDSLDNYPVKTSEMKLITHRLLQDTGFFAGYEYAKASAVIRKKKSEIKPTQADR